MSDKLLLFKSVWRVLKANPTTATQNGIAGIAGTVALWTSTFSLGSDWSAMNWIGSGASWLSLIGILCLFTNWIENQTQSKLAKRIVIYSGVFFYSVFVGLAAIIAIRIVAP